MPHFQQCRVIAMLPILIGDGGFSSGDFTRIGHPFRGVLSQGTRPLVRRGAVTAG
jgi:hypothetical protein